MDKMYFSVPYGTRELSFGITDDEGCELWNFYMIFIESMTMNSRQAIVYGDYNDDGILEEKSEVCDRHEGTDNEFEFDFDISEDKKVSIYLCMSERQYNICVSY